VWTGAQAKERGLVDALGGLDTAVAIAKQRAQIPADEEVELVMYSGRRSLYEALAELSRSSSAFTSWGRVAERVRASGNGVTRRAGDDIPARRAAGIDAVRLRALKAR
jgi:protease-4